MKKKILLGAVLIGTALYFAPERSPMGVVDATVTKEMVCVPGYSGSVRPNTNYTNALKLKDLKAKGLKASDAAKFELDHFVPISLGGSPTDPNNLWLQPYPEAHYKDTVEWDLYHKLCKGEITLQEAQKEVKVWQNDYKTMKKNLGGEVVSDDQDDE